MKIVFFHLSGTPQESMYAAVVDSDEDFERRKSLFNAGYKDALIVLGSKHFEEIYGPDSSALWFLIYAVDPTHEFNAQPLSGKQHPIGAPLQQFTEADELGLK